MPVDYSCISQQDGPNNLGNVCTIVGKDVGLYGVRLFLRGAWTTVVVDDFIPCHGGGAFTADGTGLAGDVSASAAGTPRRRGGSGKQQQPRDETLFGLWPLIIEKAWAKAAGSYAAAFNTNFEAGHTAEEVLHCLTGGSATRLGHPARGYGPAAWEQIGPPPP